jgi:hypothetical protein
MTLGPKNDAVANLLSLTYVGNLTLAKTLH